MFPPCAHPQIQTPWTIVLLQKNIDIPKFIQALKPGCLYLRIRFCLDMVEDFERQELTINSNFLKKKSLQFSLIS